MDAILVKVYLNTIWLEGNDKWTSTILIDGRRPNKEWCGCPSIYMVRTTATAAKLTMETTSQMVSETEEFKILFFSIAGRCGLSGPLFQPLHDDEKSRNQPQATDFSPRYKKNLDCLPPNIKQV